LINFFCSVEHLHAWRAEHPRLSGQTLTPGQAVGVGRIHWKSAK